VAAAGRTAEAGAGLDRGHDPVPGVRGDLHDARQAAHSRGQLPLLRPGSLLKKYFFKHLFFSSTHNDNAYLVMSTAL
jgi:hypothetical protein